MLVWEDNSPFPLLNILPFSMGGVGELDFAASVGLKTPVDLISTTFTWISQILSNFTLFHLMLSHVMLKYHFCLFRLSWNNVRINSPIHFKDIISSKLTAYGGETQWGKTRFWWRKRKSSVGLGDSSIPSLGKSRICWPNKHNFLTTLSKNLNFEPKNYWHQ